MQVDWTLPVEADIASQSGSVAQAEAMLHRTLEKLDLGRGKLNFHGCGLRRNNVTDR